MKDDLSRSVYDGMDGDLREELNRGEEGSSSGQCNLPDSGLKGGKYRRSVQATPLCIALVDQEISDKS